MDSRCLMHLLMIKTCGNDREGGPFKIVILGLACPPSFWRDPGIQGVSNLNTKDPFYFYNVNYTGKKGKSKTILTRKARFVIT